MQKRTVISRANPGPAQARPSSRTCTVRLKVAFRLVSPSAAFDWFRLNTPMRSQQEQSQANDKDRKGGQKRSKVKKEQQRGEHFHGVTAHGQLYSPTLELLAQPFALLEVHDGDRPGLDFDSALQPRDGHRGALFGRIVRKYSTTFGIYNARAHSSLLGRAGNSDDRKQRIQILAGIPIRGGSPR